jgi:hypothetical protein
VLELDLQATNPPIFLFSPPFIWACQAVWQQASSCLLLAPKKELLQSSQWNMPTVASEEQQNQTD